MYNLTTMRNLIYIALGIIMFSSVSPANCTTYIQNGNLIFSSDGKSYTKCGNTIFSSDGKSYTHLKNITFQENTSNTTKPTKSNYYNITNTEETHKTTPLSNNFYTSEKHIPISIKLFRHLQNLSDTSH